MKNPDGYISPPVWIVFTLVSTHAQIRCIINMELIPKFQDSHSTIGITQIRKNFNETLYKSSWVTIYL